MQDINDLFKEIAGTFFEHGLEAELNEELGYSEYDCRNKSTDNSRNGSTPKKLKSGFGEIEIDTPRDRKSEFEPELVKKHQTSISQYIKEWGIIHSQLEIYFPDGERRVCTVKLEKFIPQELKVCSCGIAWVLI